MSFFLPRFIDRRTSADEFHSVKKTLYPCETSQRLMSASCVDLPDPSIPSTTISLPGYGCGSVSIRLFLDLEFDVDPEQLGKQGHAARSLAFLQFGVVALGLQLQDRLAS